MTDLDKLRIRKRTKEVEEACAVFDTNKKQMEQATRACYLAQLMHPDVWPDYRDELVPGLDSRDVHYLKELEQFFELITKAKHFQVEHGQITKFIIRPYHDRKKDCWGIVMLFETETGAKVLHLEVLVSRLKVSFVQFNHMYAHFLILVQLVFGNILDEDTPKQLARCVDCFKFVSEERCPDCEEDAASKCKQEAAKATLKTRLLDFSVALAALGFESEVSMQPYRLDFLHRESKIAVELDGKNHHGAEKSGADKKRDRYIFLEYEVTTLRYSYLELEAGHDVCIKEIAAIVKKTH